MSSRNNHAAPNARWYRYWANNGPPDDDQPAPTAPGSPNGDAQPDRGPAAPTRYDRGFVLAIANQKGGVGKTTTAVSTAAALAERHLRVLLVDLDPQGNATSGLGLRSEDMDVRSTVYDVLMEGEGLDDAIVPTLQPGLWLLPATLDLAGAEVELVSTFSREHKLRRALEPAREAFDVVVVDCPPSLGLLTVNALTAADGLLVPIQCEYFALAGLGALRRNADLIREQLNPRLHILGFVLTMLDSRTRLSQQVVAEVKLHFGDRVFETRIPRTIRLAEAPGFGQPITRFDPPSRGAMAYRRLAGEVVTRLDALHRLERRPVPEGVPS